MKKKEEFIITYICKILIKNKVIKKASIIYGI